jgi:hypothetical protein
MHDMTTMLDRPLDPVVDPTPAPAKPLTDAERLEARAFDGIIMCLGRGDKPMVMWYRDNPVEVAVAESTFAEVANSGALIYRTDASDTGEREQVKTFDPAAEQYVAVQAFAGG